MLEECYRGYWKEVEIEDSYDPYHTGPDYERIWVSKCNWQPITTFKDKCLTCGKLNHYTNSNGYPEESLMRK